MTVIQKILSFNETRNQTFCPECQVLQYIWQKTAPTHFLDNLYSDSWCCGSIMLLLWCFSASGTGQTTISTALEWVLRFTFPHDNNPKHKAKTRQTSAWIYEDNLSFTPANDSIHSSTLCMHVSVNFTSNWRKMTPFWLLLYVNCKDELKVKAYSVGIWFLLP